MHKRGALNGSVLLALTFPVTVLAQQGSRYSGEVTNHGYGTSGSAGTTGSLFIDIEDPVVIRGRIDIGAPLGGSGGFSARVWSDTFFALSSNAEGDTIAWLGLISSENIRGPYRIVGGQYSGQGGSWDVNHMSGRMIAARPNATSPLPDSVRLAAFFSDFARFVQSPSIPPASGARPSPKALGLRRGEAGDYSVLPWVVLFAVIVLIAWAVWHRQGATMIQALATVMMAANFLSAPIAIVWLMIQGQWWAIGLAVVSLFSHYILGLAMLPGLALSAPAAVMAEKRPTLALILGIPGLLYTAALITIWCMGVLAFLMRGATPQTWFPLLLLSYSIGTAPWAYMAQHEIRGGGGEGAMVATFFMQLAFLVNMAYVVIGRPTLLALWIIFASIMGLQVVIAVVMAFALGRATRSIL